MNAYKLVRTNSFKMIPMYSTIPKMYFPGGAPTLYVFLKESNRKEIFCPDSTTWHKFFKSKEYNVSFMGISQTNAMKYSEKAYEKSSEKSFENSSEKSFGKFISSDIIDSVPKYATPSEIIEGVIKRSYRNVPYEVSSMNIPFRLPFGIVYDTETLNFWVMNDRNKIDKLMTQLSS